MMKKIIMFSFIFIFCLCGIVQSYDWKTTKSGYCGSVYLSDLKTFIRYIIAADGVAMDKLIASKRVIRLKAGLKVQIVDRAEWGTLIKIRPKGETVTVWTVIEAVE